MADNKFLKYMYGIYNELLCRVPAWQIIFYLYGRLFFTCMANYFFTCMADYFLPAWQIIFYLYDRLFFTCTWQIIFSLYGRLILEAQPLVASDHFWQFS